jgi:hypothetical protein
MKQLAVLLSAFVFGGAAFGAPPSQASIEKLLVDTEADKTLTSIQQQLDGMLQNTVQQATQGQPVSPEQQKILDAFKQKATATIKAQLDYNSLKNTYFQTYNESFSQEEVDQLIAFYESPTGKMFVAKMPAVTQKSMALMQQKIGPTLQQLQQAAIEMKDQLDALKATPAK